MKICPIDTLPTTDFIVKNVSAVHQTPMYRTLDVNGRFCNGFMALETGECVYLWEGGRQTLHPGDVMYLPLGSYHRLEALSEDFSFYRIDFTVTDPAGEQIVFSQTPMLFLRNADIMIMDTVKEMAELFLRNGSFFQMYSLLYRLLGQAENVSVGGSVREVIEYIRNNFTKELPMEKLESLCYLSRAQMYRDFKKETGLSPIEYRNRLRIERAKTLLCNETCSIGETAAMLGFESIYYFSRIFKKYTKISPSAYAKSRQAENRRPDVEH